VAISLHVYGADITRLGSSVRRTYDLPVLVPAG
jgi:3-mercaptopropionate dioxygenase